MIPVNEPLLNGNEKKYLSECVDTGWISSEGPFVQRLEQGLAVRMGRKYGVAVCNGTAALDVAVTALELHAGDEVILPTLTIVSCAAAVVRAGATPVVVDCDARTWNMDVTQIAERITPRTRAIMVVHIYGLPVDMAPVLALAEKHKLFVIEDAAEAIGQTYRGHPCGGFGTISVLSFYPNKHITTGEGGMVLTDDIALAGKCRSLRNLCFQKKRFVHDDLGWNLRMSNVQAALGVAQLERLDEFIGLKRRMGQRYMALFHDCPGLTMPVVATEYAENLYWVFAVVLDERIGFDAEEAMRRLAALGVGTRPFFWPMHEQPVFKKMGLFEGAVHPIAERVARRGFYVPSGLALTEAQIDHVVGSMRTLLGSR